LRGEMGRDGSVDEVAWFGFQKESQQRSVTAGAECALAIRAA
jgi:hypothetical protein